MTITQDIARKYSKPAEPGFEDLYAAIRQSEKRLYTDEQVLYLPAIDPLNIYYKEWQVRKQSGDKLIAYLQKKRGHLKILEVGCGNGWLSATLSSKLNANVIGLDNNKIEVSQAKRVFMQTGLAFIYSPFTDDTFTDEKFDVIVFAASIQYFPSLINVLKRALALLNQGGEIHIIDTPFYNTREASKATERTRKYYDELGFPKMSNHYFHHSLSEFWGFNYSVFYNPNNLFNRLLKGSPFYWIVVNK